MIGIHFPIRLTLCERVLPRVIKPPKSLEFEITWLDELLLPLFSGEVIDLSFQVRDLSLDASSSFLIGRFHLAIQLVDALMNLLYGFPYLLELELILDLE